MQNESTKANMTKPNPILLIASSAIYTFKTNKKPQTTHSDQHYAKNLQEVKHSSKLRARKSCGTLVNIVKIPSWT